MVRGLEKRPQFAYPEFMASGEGLCLTRGNANDFTESSTKPYGFAARARAAEVCGDCPFSMRCREWAQESGQTGMWGGLWFQDGKPFLRMARGKYVRTA